MTTRNNVENNAKQRRPGGVTGREFRPGKSGNPKGRPRTSGLLNALRARTAEATSDGRTVEDMLVDVLLYEALHGRNKLGAIQAIFDRLEGRPRQQVDWNDVTKAMENRTREELIFYAEHGHWPEGSGDE